MSVSTTRRKWKNEDLPAECRKGGVWRKVYVPTAYDQLAIGQDPWDNTANSSIVNNLCFLCNTIYPDLSISDDVIRGPMIGVVRHSELSVCFRTCLAMLIWSFS